MLEKEFVPYNLAKQIKQLRFKQECFGYYIDVEVVNPFLVKNIVSDDQGGYFTLAPTFSQAFRWLRENYDLRKQYGAFPHHTIITNYLIDGGVEEEAELECLKKLIEICKDENIRKST